MNISGYFGFLPENAYKTATKTGSYKFDQAYEVEQENAKYSAVSANSAHSEELPVTKTATDATANTLWQAQYYAQSPESDAIDVEPETVSVKAKSSAEQFLDFMNKTPEELMRETILKELGYTEEQLAGMEPKERALAEAKIREAIEIKIEEAMREDGVDIDGAKKAVLTDNALLTAA